MWEIAVHLAVAGGVYYGGSVFPQDVLGEILDVIESVSEGFPTYSFILSLSEDNQSDVIEAFNSASRYLDVSIEH